MEGLGYSAALVLAALFAWAGMAKLGARRRTTRTFRALGLPAADTLAVAVPAVELALAAGLAVAPGWAAAGALALLAAFSVFLFQAVRAGVDVGCGCFGSAGTDPVSPVDLLRNGFLAVAAGFALAAPTPVLPSVADVLVAATAVAVGALALAAARSRAGRIDHEGPALGSPAAPVDGVDYGAGERTLLAFTAATCPRCGALAAALADLERDRDDVQVHVVDLAAARATFDAFDVRATPYVVAVDRTGLVRGHGVAASRPDLDHLLA